MSRRHWENMQAPSGLIDNDDDDDEMKGLIGEDDDNDVELTDAKSWRHGGRRKAARQTMVLLRGSAAADSHNNNKTRIVKIAFGVAMVLFATFAIRNVLDPKHLSQRQRQQIRNYRQHAALILNVHIRSHGGIAVANAIGKAPNTTGCPSSGNCQHPHPGIDTTVNFTVYPDYNPWEYNRTATNIAIVRRDFHYLQWEYTTTAPPDQQQALSMTNWADPHLVSIFVTRDPISRMLSNDVDMRRDFPFLNGDDADLSRPLGGSIEDWMRLANDDTYGNNYALRILAGNGCCNNGTYNTDPQHYLETAKTLLSHFTFILDIDCLNEGLVAIATELGLDALGDYDHHHGVGGATDDDSENHHMFPIPSKRIPFPEAHELMVERNKLGIELHEWAKERAFVRCTDKRQRTEPNTNTAGRDDDWL